MMRAVIAPNPEASHQVYWLKCLASGLERHGVHVDVGSKLNGADFIATWGWRRAKLYRDEGANVLVVERAYLGERMTKWISLGWNGLNGRADFSTDDVLDDRAREWLPYLRPCREPTKAPVLVMGQVDGDQSWAGTLASKWYGKVAEMLSLANIPYQFRPHPIMQERGYPLPPVFERCAVNGSLDDALMRAGGVITHSSNSGVDAVLAGAPTIATDEGSMVFDVVPHNLPFEKIDEGARLRWLARMAYCQWTFAEVETGAAWDHIKKGLN